MKNILKKHISKLHFLILFFIFFHSTIVSAVNIPITPLPTWIKNINYKLSTTSEDGAGYRYLLIDLQDNIVKKTAYKHYAIKILNAEGIQNMSDLDFTYDPSYQKLNIHQIHIIRDGEIIQKTNDSNFQTFKKETNSERFVYDGTQSSVINLSDIRENDIIEYAYSIIGFNPINNGNYGRTFYQQNTTPINRIYNRLVTNSKNNIQYKLYHNALEPIILNSKNEIEYVWDLNAEDFKLYDNNTPAWYDFYKRVSITTFNNWKQVVDWAIPLFKYNKEDVVNINLQLTPNTSREEKILEIIRFVQDDIRYLGFESGISAYKPHSPKKVYNQRYGDCKDKSLLLVALLKKEGVTAFPLLVNTYEKDELSDKLPSNQVFNHCVVNITHENKNYYIDPTISNQGGDLDHISFPDYTYGLPIKHHETELLKIPKQKLPKLTINETITIDSIGGNATLKIISNYSGNKSDYIRSYFNTSTKESINKDYLNFYSSLYPNIELFSNVKIKNDYRNTTNKITTEENYIIKDFWLKNEDKANIYCETYPLVLETIVDHTNSAERSMPYYLGNSQAFSQKTTINIPEDWPIENTETKIQSEEFDYENIVKGFGKSIEITHNYTLKKDFIEGEKVADFIKKHDEIKREFSYYLLYNKDLETFKMSWVSILLTLITLALGVYISIRIYKNLNPNPLQENTNLTIGGWLVLPAINIVITAFVILFQLFSEDFFNHNIWVGILNSDLDNSYQILFFVAAELIYNVLYFTFTILIIILFFNRRSNIPILISVFYVVSFTIPLADTLITSEIFPSNLIDSDISETYKDITRSAIAAIIWIPYFHISDRVKNTFIKRYNNGK